MPAGFSLGKPGPAVYGQRSFIIYDADALPCAIRILLPLTGPKPPLAIHRMENMKHDTMIKNGQANATSMKQSSATAMDSMLRRVWHEKGVATFSIDEITDPWLRQAITNEANRRWGRRNGGNNHGR